MPDLGDSHSQQGLFESTRRFCSLFSEWIRSLTFKQFSELVKPTSSPSYCRSVKEEGSEDSMEILDISSSSDSDYDLDLDSDDDQDVESVHKPSTTVPQRDASIGRKLPSSFGNTSNHSSERLMPNWKPRSSTNARNEGFQGQRPRGTSGSGYGRPSYASHHPAAESTASTSYGADRQALNSSSHEGADFRNPKEIGSSSQSKKDDKNFDWGSSSHALDATYGQNQSKRVFPSSFKQSGVGSKQSDSWDNLAGRSGKNGGFFQQVELNAANYPNYGKDGPRILPQTLMHGKPGSSTQRAVPNDPILNMGVGEDSSTVDERSIYQAALQDLRQPKDGQDLPKGVLTVPLLRHQKIALKWMVEKETNAMCVGGILADDQGLGKTISTIALIQVQRSLQKSEKHDSRIAEALSIDVDDEEENGKKADIAKCKAEELCKVEPEILNLDDDDHDDTGGAPKGSEIKTEDVGGSKDVSVVPTGSGIKIEDVGGLKAGSSAPSGSEIKVEDVGESKGGSGASSSRQISSSQTFKRKRPSAGTLIVCPATVLRQWARELDDKVTKEQKLSVLIYHGGNRTKDPEELARYDVVVTTYSIVGNEVPKQPVVDDDDADQKLGERFGVASEFLANKKRKHPSGIGKKGKKGRKLDDNSFYNEAGTLGRVNWFRVVLDEAQTIKNHRTITARACCGLRARRRWCLSGTPIQNSIDELFSYFRFLRHHIYSDFKEFCNRIKFPISKDPIMGYKKLQAVLKTLLLRRTKDTMLDGEPIINLPPKVINMKIVTFTPEERAFYSQLEAESRAQFKEYTAAGTVNQNYANILLMILRLRQACDHPLLVRGFDSQPARRTSLDKARKLPRRTLMQLLYNLEAASAICSICSDPAEDAVITICGHVFCYQCVGDYLTGDDTMCPIRRCKQQLSEDVLFSEATLRSCLSKEEDDHLSNDNGKSKSISVLSSEYSSSKIKAALQILRSHHKLNNSCIELDDLDDADTENSMCAEVRTEKMENSSSQGPIKTIVFSQWTRMLDLFELSLNQYCIQYRRLDGSMSLNARDKAVRNFNTDPEVTVMLMSLKAGNLGLNMVAACHVILLDLWWNPTTEDQAIDRAHRIGQTRTVTVSRITIKDTVEDRILALQEEKRKMVASAFGEDHVGASGARLTIDDLKYLFMGSRGL